MQQLLAYISAHWMEGAIWLLGIGWGYLIKKVTEYRTIKDGLLAIMHDRLYQLCTSCIQQGSIDTACLKIWSTSTAATTPWGATAPARSCTPEPRLCPSVTDPLTQARPRREKGHPMNAHITTPRTVSAATIARTAVLALALINQILSALGKPLLPIESAQLEQLISTGFTTVSALVNWWFNNSFTQAALAGDEEYERRKKSI